LPVVGAVVSSTGILPEFWTVLAHSLNPFRERQGKELEEALREMDRVLREEGFEDLLCIDSLHFLSTTR
jgi:ubiquinone/menaquinone biosynthesis C-methylase UbiE